MESLQKYVIDHHQKTIAECSNEELYIALLYYTKQASAQKKLNTGKKKVYYISAEFLIGKLLSNNLINLGLYDDVKKELSDAGKDLIEVEEVELEPSLGNGGLGRLAACFIDSISSLGLTGDGVGLNYHFGLFQQVLKNNQQETDVYKRQELVFDRKFNEGIIRVGIKENQTIYTISVDELFEVVEPPFFILPRTDLDGIIIV